MRDSKRNVLAPGSGDNKPVAPPDIWEQMDALAPSQRAVPPHDSFTAEMFGERKGYCVAHARAILRELFKAGKLTRVKAGGKLWFTLVIK